METVAGELGVLVFTEDGVRYALPAEEVVEVARAVSALPLPGAPWVVEGVIDFRGAILPVLDLRARFRLPPKRVALSDHLIVARARGRLVAVRADRVLDLVNLSADSVESLSDVVCGTEYVSGVGRLPDGLVLIHDLATFLSQAESAVLDEALSSLHAEGR